MSLTPRMGFLIAKKGRRSAVPRIRSWVLRFVGWSAGLFTVGAALAVPPSENLLPDTTRGFVSAPVAKKLTDQFNKTQLGQLLKDPVMKPFTEDLRRQFDERWSNVRERLGLSLEDFKGVPAGEAAIGLIQVGRDQVAFVMLCDVTGHQEQAAAL